MSEPITVARVEDIPPGERIVVEVGRDWILIINIDGEFYAVRDECTHEEYPLSEGMLHGCQIECRKHGARFDMRTGEVTAPPAVVPVKRYPVLVVNGEVQIVR